MTTSSVVAPEYARFVADLRECHTVIPHIGSRVEALSQLVDSLEARADIPQIEFIAGDTTVALVFRHMQPLSEADRGALVAFDRLRGAVRTFVLHRITGIRPVSDAELEAESVRSPAGVAREGDPP